MQSRETTDAVSPELVDERLRACARLSANAPPPPPPVDMSPEAVTARLDEWAEVSALAWELVLAGETADRGR